MTKDIKINDDSELLKIMMDDYWIQDKRNQADEFWKNYEIWNLRMLQNYGLREFLNRSNSFGGIFTKKSIFPEKISYFFNLIAIESKFTKICQGLGLKIFLFKKIAYNFLYKWVREDPDAIRQRYGDMIFQLLHILPNGGRLYELNDDLIGNPSEILKFGDKYYSLNFLEYFWKALLLEKYLDLSHLDYFFEIGAGYGGQADVLLKMFPNLRICITDIPPQLYVIEQYLKALFPDDVLGYKESKRLQSIDKGTFADKRIIVVAPWEVKKIKDNTFENFTNQASFQEMSHETVRCYCRELNRLVSNGIFLFEQREGCGGVKNPVTKNDYIEYLTAFKIVESKTTLLGGHLGNDPNRPFGHNDIYVFKKTA
ncbi:MAG: putative sugar O-methyltransferase [Candidatus Omnitrophica bacterium]|jgi:putative sugar O-methyltransferase|nr:putative sugar O-methyltransferase [Candidatus Omnitrophota bacterium]